MSTFVLAAFVRPAAAKTREIQVLTLYSDDAYDQAHALTVALKNAIRHRSSYSLGEGDYSLEVLTLALGCNQPPDDACQARIASKIGSSRYVWGTMSRDGNDVVAHLSLWERGSTTRQTQVKYTSNLTTAADDSLRLIASRAANELLSGSSQGDRDGLLVVDAGNVNGLLFVDDELVGRIHNGHAELTVPVGRRRVAVEARGYERASGNVIVHGDGPAEVVLDPERSYEPHFASESYGDSGDEDDEDEGTGHGSSAGAWAAMGAGALMIGGGLYSASEVRKVNQDDGYLRYRAGLRSEQNACTEASRGTVVPGAATPTRVSDLCDRSHTFEALQYVLFGLGTVSAGAGLIMLLSGDEPAEADRTTALIRPEVDVEPGGARVHLSVTF